MSKDNTILRIPIGDALLGRTISVAGEPLDGLGPLDAPRVPIERRLTAGEAPERQPQIFETGIKVVDLFAPMTRSGAHGMFSVAGVGKLVLMCELAHTLSTRRGGVVVLVSSEDDWRRDLSSFMREAGVDKHLVTVLSRAADPVDGRVALAGLTIAEQFCAQGRDTLLFVDAALIIDSNAAEIRARLRNTTPGALILVVYGDELQIDTPLAPLDASLLFSFELAKQKIWPAVDPLTSSSRLLTTGAVSEEHVRVANAAGELLRTSDNQQSAQLRERARRLQLFQGQPFVVAEPYTATPGVYVSLEDTIRSYGELLDGKHDNVPEETIRFGGSL
jgi:F-type H+-transporting ATPase subunit beta